MWLLLLVAPAASKNSLGVFQAGKIWSSGSEGSAGGEQGSLAEEDDPSEWGISSPYACLGCALFLDLRCYEKWVHGEHLTVGQAVQNSYPLLHQKPHNPFQSLSFGPGVKTNH